MNVNELVYALREVIINNCNLEGEPDDSLMFDGLESIEHTGNELVLHMNGSAFRIRVLEIPKTTK